MSSIARLQMRHETNTPWITLAQDSREYLQQHYLPHLFSEAHATARLEAHTASKSALVKERIEELEHLIFGAEFDPSEFVRIIPAWEEGMLE